MRENKFMGVFGGGFSMKVTFAGILAILAVVGLTLFESSCASTPANCPTCGTTVNGAYTPVNIIPVPEHNPTGEPGGPFNSFDISWFDPIGRKFYVSDRIGLAIVVVDTKLEQAVNTIGGINAVTQAGNNFSPCLGNIPPLLTALGNFTRFGCRNGAFTIPTFGANGSFGGFPGAQCCAARANGVNPLSGPDGNLVSPDGNTLFVGNGSSSVAVFDLTSPAATVIATIPTGASPDYDGQQTPNPGTANNGGIGPCVASANGRAFSDITCGDLRADEMSYAVVGGRSILLVANGDPGLPFVTLIDVTAIVNRPAGTPASGFCLPVNPANPYSPGPPFATNFPTCIIGQIYYDGTNTISSTVPVDSAAAPCPNPSLGFPPGLYGGAAVPSGVSGTGVGAGGANVPCHHSAIVNQNTGAFVTSNGTAGAGQGGEIAVAGIGGSAFNPFHNTFYVTNANCTVSTLATQASVAVGCVDEVDPRLGNPNGPIVVAVIPTINCMPSGVVQGPGHDFLIGCGDHDGIAFPPNMFIMDGTTNQIVTTINQTGGVDEVWFNPGDNRYYLAARDFPSGPQMGVIDAAARRWLVNVGTNSNSHSIAADNISNHIFVPSQAGGICGTQRSNGCVLVYARQ